MNLATIRKFPLRFSSKFRRVKFLIDKLLHSRLNDREFLVSKADQIKFREIDDIGESFYQAKISKIKLLLLLYDLIIFCQCVRWEQRHQPLDILSTQIAKVHVKIWLCFCGDESAKKTLQTLPNSSPCFFKKNNCWRWRHYGSY